MTVIKARPILLITAAAAAMPALAQVEPSAVLAVAKTTASTRIEQPAVITNSQDLVFAVQAPVAAALSVTPTITAPRVTATGSAVTSGSATTTASSGASASARTTTAQAAGSTPDAASLVRSASSSFTTPVPAAAQATFTVSGDSGQAISVIVPPKVEMAGSNGVETALLTTTNNLSDGPQFLGGTFAGGGTLSFAVGGQVTLANNTTVSSGTYNGLLAVVAQYN